MIKRYLLILSVTLFFTSCEVLSQLPNAMGTGVTEAEAGQGIKEALGQGLTRAVSNLNKTDAFFGNAFYKILLPPEVQKVERTLRNIGLGQTVDKAILQINRGAEDAVGFAAPIFVNAIKQMTITDGINILRGDETAATSYLRSKTATELKSSFNPIVKTSLDKVNATKYWERAITAYNAIPFSNKKINPDLGAYVTEKAMEGIYSEIAKQEKDIRANPMARTSELLKRVFEK